MELKDAPFGTLILYPEDRVRMVRCVFRIFLAAACLLPIPGCLDDDFMDTMVRENGYYSFTVNEADPRLTAYFPISDSGQTTEYRAGDDGSFINTPDAIDLQNMDNYSGNDDVVRDNVTGFMWTKCSALSLSVMDTDDNCAGAAQAYEWQDAYDLCDNLDYASFSDWRLPTAAEFFSITDFAMHPPVNPSTFPDTANAKYWTSTLDSFLGPVYFYFNFETDITSSRIFTNINFPLTTYFVRCVRGPE